MKMGRIRVMLGRARRVLRLERLRTALNAVRGGATVELAGFRIAVTDGPNAYMQYKDVFVRRVYAFESAAEAPVVIDGGANMGLFSLATLRDHPGARIVAFEPDPQLFALLRSNLESNGAGHITTVNAALAATEGTLVFAADGQAGGSLRPAGTMQVRAERLSSRIAGPVDFLKLNIEGAELEVLEELRDSGAIRQVAAMVVEYHGWPDGEQRLGAILQLLDACGFRYMLHDQDEQSNPLTKPPFRPQGSEPWFVLIYAWQPGRVP